MNREVRAFHRKHGFPLDEPMPTEKDTALLELGFGMNDCSDDILPQSLEVGDNRLYRAHLMLEEMSEMLLALGNADRIKVADAGADLLYVVIGTLETYGIDAKQVFDAVHASNMTKSVRSIEDQRMRSKGPHYHPPQIAEAIRRGEESRAWNQSIGELE